MCHYAHEFFVFLVIFILYNKHPFMVYLYQIKP